MPGDAVGAAGLRGGGAHGQKEPGRDGAGAQCIREATRSVLAAGHHRALGSRTVGWSSSRGTMRHIPAGTGLGQQLCKAGGLSGRHRAVLSSSF